MSVYFLEGDAPGLGGKIIKIGFSGNVEQRVKGLIGSLPFKAAFLGHMAGDRDLERQLHERFGAHHHHGEWFHDHPELRATIDAVAIKTLPSRGGVPQPERMRQQEERYAEECAANIEAIIDLLGARGKDIPTLAEIVTKPLGITPGRFISIWMGEAQWVTAGEYTIILSMYEAISAGADEMDPVDALIAINNARTGGVWGAKKHPAQEISE